MSVTRGQCDARPTVTFPATRHHLPLAGTKLYSLVTEAHVLTTCPWLRSTVGRPGFEPCYKYKCGFTFKLTNAGCSNEDEEHYAVTQLLCISTAFYAT